MVEGVGSLVGLGLEEMLIEDYGEVGVDAKEGRGLGEVFGDDDVFAGRIVERVGELEARSLGVISRIMMNVSASWLATCGPVVVLQAWLETDELPGRNWIALPFWNVPRDAAISFGTRIL